MYLMKDVISRQQQTFKNIIKEKKLKAKQTIYQQMKYFLPISVYMRQATQINLFQWQKSNQRSHIYQLNNVSNIQLNKIYTTQTLSIELNKSFKQYNIQRYKRKLTKFNDFQEEHKNQKALITVITNQQIALYIILKVNKKQLIRRSIQINQQTPNFESFQKRWWHHALFHKW
ncbi:unnamed protein product (macronuclear) [Paramecium tetraurelia]|uniref:Transmembrane protein n=1 Tax=Paramecium tetraurelia TaxID=5888 RepID=A0D8T0_PARTE|nr:uncharacterized protein GSPATT00014393001 [Paramecium tetraurelia]CAK79447.1 unnamed protein product [Paramecium tetraurelia]|eukprot:XP_001446844.1 hypothetical protein (macronuclear) [Paramecium tetraurelia strain d4-2]